MSTGSWGGIAAYRSIAVNREAGADGSYLPQSLVMPTFWVEPSFADPANAAQALEQDA